MTWQTNTIVPEINTAVYFLVLPVDGVVKYSSDLGIGMFASSFYGNLSNFVDAQLNGTPLIPVDMHLGITMGWVDHKEALRNMPYITEKVMAAVSLVIDQ